MGHAVFLFDLGVAFAVLVQIYYCFLEFFRVTGAFRSCHFFFLLAFYSIIPPLLFVVHFFSIAPKSDTAECEKLSEQKALLIYQSLCKQYSCEGQALADMIAREHEQAATSVADDESVSENSYDDVADEEEMLGQTSFFEKKNPYSD